MKRHYYYDCNVVPAWQTSMAKFLTTAKKSDGTVSDTTRGIGGEGGAGSDFSLNTCTVGQDKTSEDRIIGDENEHVLDEL